MKIGSADTARIDLNIDVIISELLQLERSLVEVSISLRAVYLESNSFLWIWHLDGLTRRMVVLGNK